MTARLVVLVSGSGSNLGAVLDACADGRLAAQVVAVISNRSGVYALERARLAGVSAEVTSLKAYRERGLDRRRYDADLADLVAGYEPDWVILAGWMHVLSSAFLARFAGQVVNLHPALPGEFPGAHAITDAFEAARSRGLNRTGVMVHLVPDEEIDAGPVLGQVEVPILASDTLESLEERMHLAEHELLVDVLSRLIG